ncbi:MAG: alpha-D-glucose phosphate-specific phosphoglucomutase [Desulfobacterales bacterium]|nr:alpha-D-glucose phosphate-specific phosphoglucomutase [Desulfobacterales bacterium]
MAVHKLAGKPAPRSLLVNIPQLVSSYFLKQIDTDDLSQRIEFGTSGHRGSSFKWNFNEAHILAITQAICDYRQSQNITGPLFMGKDTHALSEPSHATALEVLAANGVEVVIHQHHQYTPTPVISHAILCANKGKTSGLADGIVITPSHNPPEDGGFKYNPPHGGPADTKTTLWIQETANTYLINKNSQVKRIPFEKACMASTTHEYDYIKPYVDDLINVIDIETIRVSSLKMGVDPLGGASIEFWSRIADTYKLNLQIVNTIIDPTFGFMTVDKDGKIRMDCSSSYAMAGLISLKDQFDIAFGNDPDVDRHGIVTPSVGLLNPNHYLSVAIFYLFQHRNQWPKSAAIGKTLVSSAMIDRVAQYLDRKLCEVPVGFKWFVDGLLSSAYGFGGEESAGASFLRKDGTVWTTDKDGIIMNLLAAEITAKTGRDPGIHYKHLTQQFGDPIYERIDAPANAKQKALLQKLSPDQIQSGVLAGDPIIAKITNAQGNNASIGGLKVITENGWFAARPSGTEDVYKIYTESFKDKSHLTRIQEEAKQIINAVFEAESTS